MAKRQNNVERFKAELAGLNRSISDDLRLPSMREDRMEGFAAFFIVALPLLNSAGQPVFTNPVLEELFLLIDQRFGGLLVPSASSHPPYWGLWRPTGSAASEKDYVTTIQICNRSPLLEFLQERELY
ncbi:MAG: hypothetical protein HYR84_12850 [Planctomycetes bacterium]|nr:hypothetical protein [Planctomycetota bacterium]